LPSGARADEFEEAADFQSGTFSFLVQGASSAHTHSIHTRLNCVHSRADALREMSASAREKQLNALDAAVLGWRKGLGIVEMEEGRRFRPRPKELVSCPSDSPARSPSGFLDRAQLLAHPSEQASS
jgi:hypothetical protein